ncbi:hypothetical protein [Actinoplanes sp. NPDC049265]|uniref:hypothetical protein n=1 Tax=Actinoplanes sp. NPDC049265 TaxID=3363902 RepID=UPI003715E453
MVTRVALRLMLALLPEDFRDRQRDEWTGDLLALTSATDRRRYLAGAARTLPSLRRAAHRRPAPDEIEVEPVVGDTVARVLMSGLLFSMLAFYLFVPLRYYAIADATTTDPKDVWPLNGDPGPLLPLWAVFSLTGWAVALGSVFLLVSVTITGLVATAISRHRYAIGLVAALLLTLPAGLVASLIFALTGGEDHGYTAGLLGLVALLLAYLRKGLPRRTRILLALAGVAAVILPIWTATPSGTTVLWWWFD